MDLRSGSHRLSPVPGGPGIDLPAAEHAVKDLLEALGFETSDEVLSATPIRVAKAYRDMLTPEEFEMTTFPNDQGYDELIVAGSIQFYSLCAHHMLPFVGVAHVGYLPGDCIVGLSKLARVVEYYSRTLQVQEHLTAQIATCLQENLHPRGVGVVMEAEHMCMSLRGVSKPGARTKTSALHGVIRDDPRTRQEFFSLVGNGS
ncbi:MAG: GTP cyclohydrolase I FolE [Actinomycetota bacterium]